MDINTIWAVVEPYITGIAGTATGGLIVGIICRLLQGKLLRRLDVGDIADKVAGRLTGKTLNIDVTAVTEKRLDKIEAKLSKKVEAIEEQTAAYKHLLALIGGAVAHFKALPEEEKHALQEAVTGLKGDYTPPPPEQVTTVKLEPITLDEDEEEKDTAGELINFGGLSL